MPSNYVTVADLDEYSKIVKSKIEELEQKIDRKARPIFTVGLPMGASLSAIEKVRTDLDIKLGDEYHVLVYRAQEIDGLTFNVLNVVDANDVEVKELIEKAKDTVESLLNEKNNIENHE